MPRVKSVADRAADPAEAAVAAMVLARGRPALGRPRFREAHCLGRPQPVRLHPRRRGRLRGRVLPPVMFEGPAGEGEAGSTTSTPASGCAARSPRAESTGPATVARTASSSASCPALPRRPGLLGISGDRQARPDLVSHERPPLPDLPSPGLPGAPAPAPGRRDPSRAAPPAAARPCTPGWPSRHARRPASPCTPDDVPDNPDAWSAGRLGGHRRGRPAGRADDRRPLPGLRPAAPPAGMPWSCPSTG